MHHTLTSIINCSISLSQKSMFTLGSIELKEMDLMTRFAQEQELINEFLHGFFPLMILAHWFIPCTVGGFMCNDYEVKQMKASIAHYILFVSGYDKFSFFFYLPFLHLKNI